MRRLANEVHGESNNCDREIIVRAKISHVPPGLSLPYCLTPSRTSFDAFQTRYRTSNPSGT